MGWVYLVLSIFFTAAFASCYKIANRRSCDLINVNTTVYFSGSLTLAVAALLMQRAPATSATIIMGIFGGFVAYITTISFFYVMMERHISTAWTIISLAVVIPIFASIVVYHEYPKPLQWVGLLLMCMALGSLSLGRGGDKSDEEIAPDGSGNSPWRGRLLFFVSFLGTGIIAFSNKMLVEMEGQSQVPIYMLIYYVAGALTAVAFRAWRPKTYQHKDLAVGGIMGFVGALSILTFVMALTFKEAIIIFPVRACANLLLTAMVGFIVWRERPGLGGTLGILLGAMALVLVNMK